MPLLASVRRISGRVHGETSGRTRSTLPPLQPSSSFLASSLSLFLPIPFPRSFSSVCFLLLLLLLASNAAISALLSVSFPAVETI